MSTAGGVGLCLSPATPLQRTFHRHRHRHRYCLHPPPPSAAAMAMATLALPPLSLPCAPSLRLSAPSSSSASTSRPALLGAKGLLNVTSLRLQIALGASKQAPQRRRFRCQAESVDKNETVAAGEQKVSEVKESISGKQGPPFLFFVAGIVVAALVIWGLWSLVSAILGIIFH